MKCSVCRQEHFKVWTGHGICFELKDKFADITVLNTEETSINFRWLLGLLKYNKTGLQPILSTSQELVMKWGLYNERKINSLVNAIKDYLIKLMIKWEGEIDHNLKLKFYFWWVCGLSRS